MRSTSERAQEGVIRALRLEGQRLQEGGRKLPDGTVTRAKEINRAIMARANQLRGLFHGRPHDGFAQNSPPGRSSMVASSSTCPSARKMCSFSLVERAIVWRKSLSSFWAAVVFPEALIIEFDRYIGVVDEGLLEKRHQDRIASQGVHALELGHWSLPAQLGQPFHPVGVERDQLPGVDPGLVQELDLRERVDELGSGGRCGFSA